MLRIQNLTASIEGKIILQDISFSFEDEKTYTLIGPNGSGKSTLASAILGRPDIVIDAKSKIFWNQKMILSMTPDHRARLGIFGTFQSPPPLHGVSIFSLLRHALPKTPALETRHLIETYSKELSIPEALLHRGLHDGFSGGEKKKFETLLWAMLQPKISFFDELDTGVDVDAQKIIGNFLKSHRKPKQTFVIITHSTAFLDILSPNETLVLDNGKLTKTGDGKLARHIIEREGFAESIKNSK